MSVKADILHPGAHAPGPPASEQQDKETDHLSGNRRCGCTGNPHVKTENQQRVQTDIDDGTGQKADHGVKRVPLEPQLVVDDKLSHHKGRARQNNAHINERIPHCRLRGSEHAAHRHGKTVAEDRCGAAQHKRQCKARGGHVLRFVHLPRAHHA